ncbi:hypothetical protein BD410DRAFT_783610 [Rickenella mellea]|uniref:Uncharacterized protein n=1 Tax=Rickenella mellea TaxID=50990 RepID=A0A4Y7QFU6_9AGAM|nr:hypothetical protein BD410DRAFT_783610 [Rickenella mellea]
MSFSFSVQFPLSCLSNAGDIGLGQSGRYRKPIWSPDNFIDHLGVVWHVAAFSDTITLGPVAPFPQNTEVSRHMGINEVMLGVWGSAPHCSRKCLTYNSERSLSFKRRSITVRDLINTEFTTEPVSHQVLHLSCIEAFRLHTVLNSRRGNATSAMCTELAELTRLLPSRVRV